MIFSYHYLFTTAYRGKLVLLVAKVILGLKVKIKVSAHDLCGLFNRHFVL